MAPEQTWRRSGRSQNNQNCVELSNTLDQIRDSKNAAGPALPGNVPTLVQTIKAGRFDH